KQLYLSAGMTDESVSLAYCICSGEISKDNLEEDEDIETILVSREEAKELLLKDEKFDIKAFMALQSFVALGEDLFKK
ncbi:MAG: DNA mismatch repair protein MutT, partial [Clostridium celatum]|nr:DNA mismatch repair protein MutT [Clostridium celatum]